MLFEECIAIRTECIQAVSQAIGRNITTSEADGIEKTILGNMARIARADPAAWRSMSIADRYAVAAQDAAKQLVADAQVKANRLALNIAARAKVEQRFKAQVNAGLSGANAAERILNQVDTYIKGVSKESFSNMMDAIDAADPKLFGLMENPEANARFIRELFGESTGDELAVKGVKAWNEVSDQMRERFNRSGGDIGKLDYGYIPQPHNQASVLKAGVDEWVDFISPKLDRSRYVDAAGNPMSDVDFTDFLTRAWQTIATGGINKLDPDKVSFGSSFANKGSQSREIHFKDADSWLEYQDQFGKGTMFDAMQSHVNGLARNIGIVEQFGPNPQATFDMLNTLAVKTDGKVSSVGIAGADLQSLYNVLTGANNIAVNPQIADINQGIRNLTVAGKLQGTVLSSVTDIPTLIATAKYNKLPIFDTMANVIKSFGSDYKDYANGVGLQADSVISDMSRFFDGHMSQGITSRLASGTMKVSLLNAWTDSLKRGFQISMQGATGKLSRKAWNDIDVTDRQRLEFQGVTPDVFSTWNKATPENWRGSLMLTPDSIRAIPDDVATIQQKDEAVARLLGFIQDESDYAITTPDLTTRASLGGGTQKGTVPGEIARHLSLFKSFPLAMANRHIRRATSMNGEQGGIGYSVALMGGLVSFGALAMQLKSLASGKDPADMKTPKFWGAAFAQGGGLGILGDIFYTGLGGNNRSGQANWASLAGPVVSTGIDFLGLTLGNLGQYIRGEKPEKIKAGAELVRFTKSNLPFANLWYIRAAVDRLFLNDLQETLSPGYLSRLRKNSKKEFSQGYYWDLGDPTPNRAPDFANAIGE